jgi:hypothetical protein
MSAIHLGMAVITDTVISFTPVKVDLQELF